MQERCHIYRNTSGRREFKGGRPRKEVGGRREQGNLRIFETVGL